MKRRIVIEFDTSEDDEGVALFNEISEVTFQKWDRTQEAFKLKDSDIFRESVNFEQM